MLQLVHSLQPNRAMAGLSMGGMETKRIPGLEAPASEKVLAASQAGREFILEDKFDNGWEAATFIAAMDK